MTNKSHLTAIKRTKLSAPMQWLKDKAMLGTGWLTLDYGCGKGDDAKALRIFAYDPYHFPNVIWALKEKWDVITCNYVLNTVDPIEATSILQKIAAMLAPNGVAYISVRRDVKKDGFTKRGTYQRNVVLNLPVAYEKKNSFCIYRLDKTAIV